MRGHTNTRKRNPELYARKVSPWSFDGGNGGSRIVRRDGDFISSIWAGDGGVIAAHWLISGPSVADSRSGGCRSVEDAKRIVLVNLKRLGAVKS